MKSYTDIEQSKKLVEILPLESADYARLGKNEDNVLTRTYFESRSSELKEWIDENNIFPCWSLATLLNILPKGTNISTPKSTNELGYCCWNEYGEFYADNVIDACYKMILKLNKLKLL